MTEEQTQESIGRIEVAPEVLATIARFAALRVAGVARMAALPSETGRIFRRATKHKGVLLNLVDNKLTFDIYVIMAPDVNIMEASQNLQAAIIEAIDTMVGIPVEAVNIHVEDVTYAQNEADS